jgi:ATP-dependent helicase/nuclease subunit B
VQIEAMRVRLRQLALVQAAERRDGWRIIESEYAVKKEDGLAIGPLTLTGTMDRVEVHEERGLRILDYKTFAKVRTPEETHFGPADENHHLPEAAIARPSKNGALREKSWTDLQLPLYRRLAAHLWPAHASKGLAAGYILLPGDPDDTQISLLSLDEATQSLAEICATAIAERVAHGVFWPPTPAADIRYDDFADWFSGADPAEIFNHATIARLEGSR